MVVFTVYIMCLVCSLLTKPIAACLHDVVGILSIKLFYAVFLAGVDLPVDSEFYFVVLKHLCM